MTSRRSAIVGLVAIAVSRDLRGQKQPPRVARIGYLTARALEFERRWLGAFREGLRDLGYVEGNNITIEQRHAAGAPEKLRALATELVALKVDILVATDSTAALAAKAATAKIPIVSFTQDPVALGLAASLARPGGNVTGVSDFHSAMGAKRLELLKEVTPAATRFAVFLTPGLRPNRLQLEELQRAAATLRVTLLPFEIGASDAIERAFAAFPREGVGGLLLLPGAAVSSHQRQIAERALKHRLPAIYTVYVWAELGGLLSYGTNFNDYYRRAATYVDKILKGANPADLPIEEPTRFELVVNMKTARAIGVTIPQTILIRADRVIDR